MKPRAEEAVEISLALLEAYLSFCAEQGVQELIFV